MSEAKKFNDFEPAGITGPTVEFNKAWDRVSDEKPCFIRGVKVSDSCLACPLAVCKHDDWQQAWKEVKAWATE